MGVVLVDGCTSWGANKPEDWLGGYDNDGHLAQEHWPLATDHGGRATLSPTCRSRAGEALGEP